MEFEEIIDRLSEYQDIKVLPDTIAIGKVLKIHVAGNLEEEGYESGYLFLPKGSGIKEHTHTDDEEFYTLIKGILSIKGKQMTENFCEAGKSHSIDRTLEDTVISYHKITVKEKTTKNNKDAVLKK